MIFNTPIFFLFFCAFLLFYGLIFARRTPRVWIIVIASLVFYGAWNYRFIPLLLFSAIADYFIALAIGRASDPARRKRWVTLSIAINLGVLGLFKYADFVLVSVADFLRLFGIQADMPTLSWVLPVGISFYTFQSLSYTIDVYRGDMQPRKGLLEFVAALSFFPQLVAGPILRASQILPQMHRLPVPQWTDVTYGIVLITAGVFKKTTADLLAIPAQKLFDSGEAISLLETWTGVLAFAGQIYGDFAGYTDMAIGIALLLGFRIPLNFRVPYFAISPVDFWRRWHISLSTWLRDYLYISLGGNRNNRRTFNVMVTMLLGGLWHGAAWTFVAWGAFHGVIITATHHLGKLLRAPRWLRPLQWALTFYLVLLGWVLFRASSLGSAGEIVARMHGLAESLPAPSGSAMLVLWMVAGTTALMHLMDLGVLRLEQPMRRRPRIFWWLLIPIVLIQVICLMLGEPSDEFIYFQF